MADSEDQKVSDTVDESQDVNTNQTEETEAGQEAETAQVNEEQAAAEAEEDKKDEAGQEEAAQGADEEQSGSAGENLDGTETTDVTKQEDEEVKGDVEEENEQEMDGQTQEVEGQDDTEANQGDDEDQQNDEDEQKDEDAVAEENQNLEADEQEPANAGVEDADAPETSQQEETADDGIGAQEEDGYDKDKDEGEEGEGTEQAEGAEDDLGADEVQEEQVGDEDLEAKLEEEKEADAEEEGGDAEQSNETGEAAEADQAQQEEREAESVEKAEGDVEASEEKEGKEGEEEGVGAVQAEEQTAADEAEVAQTEEEAENAEVEAEGDGADDAEKTVEATTTEEAEKTMETEPTTMDSEQAEATEQQEAAAEATGADVQVEVEDTDENTNANAAGIEQEQSDLNDNEDVNQNAELIPPPPHLPGAERSYTEIEGQMSTSALNVIWSFGLNRNVPVLNLSDGVRQAIMYPCAHVGIMYDFKNNKQHILQAHLNPITCSAVSQDKRWLVTGDVGPDAMVNIWDTYTGTPIQTMFDPNPQGGVVAVALTPDSRYLATLSALPTQTLAIWDWTVDGDVPICSADLSPDYGLQNFIFFDPSDIHHVVTNSETQVLFYQWSEGTMKYYAPPLKDSDFNKPVGRYSQSLFQVGIARALTATSIGNLVVWDNNKPLSKIMDVNQSADKKPLKIIKVHDKGINVLTTTDSYIVIGDTSGHVKFFDQGLRLIYWYADFHSGPCTAISFAYMPDFVPVAAEGSKYPSDSTKQAQPFVVRNFIVGTAIAVYCSMNTDGSRMKIIHREHDAAVHALACHPKLPVMAMGSYSGLLKLWNYRTKETVCSRMFEKCHIQTCAFDPKGFFIAVGMTNGSLYLVDSVALLDQINVPFKSARDAITHIAFAHNSSYLATADAGFTITVYKRQRKEGRNLYTWHGRYRSHYKPIKDLLFDIHLDNNQPKLLSLGEDRMLIEYDLHHQGKTHNHVVPLAQDRIEQSAIPQCMTKYPPITKEHFFLTANDQYKLKCYNSTTKMCRKIVLGPTYGSPIRKMMVVPTEKDDSTNRFLAYITDDKVGLHFLPATGNPHLAMALIAHPSGVSNLACSFDGAYLFTSGGPDFAVHMWEINIAALEAQAKLGGEDLVPFYGLLEGGRDGELFAELEDLFYYAQLRHQGINSTERRVIGNKVPLSEVPFIMRAMGFYPSEQEIEDMLNEIKYDEYVNKGHYQEDVDLGQFIRLYVNHRPAFGLPPEKLLWAFQTLAENADDAANGDVMERGDLLDILQKHGEHMTEFELAEHLATLLGFNKEGGACEQEVFDSEEAGAFIANALPFDITADIMMNEILGFSMTVDPPAPDDTKDVVKSSAF